MNADPAVWVQWLGLCAGVITVFRALPQALKIFWSRDIDGVSRATWGLNLTSGIIWLVWSIREHNFPNLIANIGVIVAAGAVLFALGRARVAVHWVGGANLLVLIGAVCAARYSLFLLDAAAIIVPSCFFVPQAYTIRKSRDASGVSWLTWSSAGMGNLLWFVYGVALGSPEIIIPAVVSFPPVGIILFTLGQEHRKNRLLSLDVHGVAEE